MSAPAFHRRRVLLAQLVLLPACLMLVGCAPLLFRQEPRSTNAKAALLPQLTMPPNVVILEIAEVELQKEQIAQLESVWREIDEQHLPPEQRRELNANGIRCGKVDDPLPPVLRKLVDPLSATEQAKAEAGGTPQPLIRNRDIRMPKGNQKDLPVGLAHPELTLLTKEGGALRGKTLRNAQCILKIRPEDSGDAGAKLHLEPLIVHGQTRQSWKADGGAWKMAPQREQREFPKLSINVRLAAGESVLLTATAEPRGVGRSFFAPGNDRRRAVLIRLSHAQEDQLFAPEEQQTAPAER